MKNIKPTTAKKQKRPAFKQGAVNLVSERVFVALLRSGYKGEYSQTMLSVIGSD
ncbi:hypothetical protein VRK_19400 [Vibrio sp. MEBiC08052]|nr:hypothetical protein VRK_19400 [Vibrio sp. MEBiC08052]